MFKLNFSIYNFLKVSNYFRNIFWSDTEITNNKCIELECFYSNSNVLEFNLDLSFWGSHHAGPSLTIGILGYTCSLRLYDKRHWDYDVNDWKYVDRFHDN
jgi:hypothetical protein